MRYSFRANYPSTNGFAAGVQTHQTVDGGS